MRLSKRAFRILIFFVGAAAGAGVFVFQHRPPPPPKQLAFWFWHSPFRISREESESLERMGVDRLFVRAATISNSGNGPTAILEQTWREGTRLPVHLTIPFDRGILVHFEELDLKKLAGTVINTFQRHRLLAEKTGVRVKGLQIDFDCPTRLLPLYAQLLGEIRKGLSKGSELSIAALATWLGADSFRQVLEPLDFYCPQFYEGEVPKRLEEFKPVATISNIERGIRQAERWGKPYFVGLPAYGHALMFDADGKLAGTLRGLSPSEAAKTPDLKWSRTDALGGDGAVAESGQGFGLDLSVFESKSGVKAVFEMPSARLIRNVLKAARQEAGRHCLGYSLFRFPEAEEELSVPLPALEAAVRGKPAAAVLEAKWTSRYVPWPAIEAPDGRAPMLAEVMIELENVGRGPTRLEPEGVRIVVEAPKADLETAEPGDAHPSFLRHEAMGALTMDFRVARLGPGEKREIGPVRVYVRESARLQAKISWPDGENPVRRTLELPEWKPRK